MSRGDMTAEHDQDLPPAKRRRLIFWAVLRGVPRVGTLAPRQVTCHPLPAVSS